MDAVQGEWIVKRRNCAATLNNRGSHHRQAIDFRWLFLFLQGFILVASLKIETFGFFSKIATNEFFH